MAMLSDLKIIAWDLRDCNRCKTRRVHYKTSSKWHCIGTLDDVQFKCGSGPPLERKEENAEMAISGT